MQKPVYASEKSVESPLPSEKTSQKSVTTISSTKNQKAVLVLEDGSTFSGYGFGAEKKVSGEIVFSTSMVGYPEALTDPSYKGQILTLTYPLVGNYGVPQKEYENGILKNFESERIQVTGLVIHELCRHPNHWASTQTLDDWFREEGVSGIYGIDTRRLTKKLRVKGVMKGILQVCAQEQEPSVERLKEEANKAADPNQTDLVHEVAVREPVYYKTGGKDRVVLIDCGVKYSILRNLLNHKVDVLRVPYTFSAAEILEFNPKGVVLSNGPGDPKKCATTIECVRTLVAEKIPIMSICLGTQILALALGADTYKLTYGHRSQNQPALDLQSNRCYITTQNHGYAVSKDSLEKTDLEAWFINANDHTIEGIKHKSLPAFAVQWHPEASPGPYDTEFLFDEFLKAWR